MKKILVTHVSRLLVPVEIRRRVQSPLSIEMVISAMQWSKKELIIKQSGDEYFRVENLHLIVTLTYITFAISLFNP